MATTGDVGTGYDAQHFGIVSQAPGAERFAQVCVEIDAPDRGLNPGHLIALPEFLASDFVGPRVGPAESRRTGPPGTMAPGQFADPVL